MSRRCRRSYRAGYHISRLSTFVACGERLLVIVPRSKGYAAGNPRILSSNRLGYHITQIVLSFAGQKLVTQAFAEMQGLNTCQWSSMARLTFSVDPPQLHANDNTAQKHRQAHDPSRDLPGVRTLTLIHGLASLADGFHARLRGGELGYQMSKGRAARRGFVLC